MTSKRKLLIILLLSTLFTFSADVKAQEKTDLDLGKFFNGYKGTFVMLDVKKNSYIRYNEQQAAERHPPCSTFKILNSLIGLETGVIEDENFVLKWDGKPQRFESWNRDHNLQSAITNSVVWYYQELASRVGEKRMKKYIQSVGYGNGDISGGIRKFWLMNSLKVSANEQVDFLHRLYKNDLPFSQRSIDIVKKITKLSETDKYTFRGKTGSGLDYGKYNLGWFIGYVEHKDNVYIFATNILGEGEVNGKKAREITEAILKEMGLI
jgi:beta-lactamase class D